MINFYFPRKLVFGDNCYKDFIDYFITLKYKSVFIIADPNIKEPLEIVSKSLKTSGIEYQINTDVTQEPTVSTFNDILKIAESHSIDSVIGIGGGSVMDVAKLLAAMCFSGIEIESVFGNGKLLQRSLFLACMPTTAGTGSEVSPNSILLDEKESLKKEIISPFLVPDASYIDPVLTHTMPHNVTASTGIDALTHCIEAYTNKSSHPMTDLYALEGISLIFNNLYKAYNNGSDVDARREVALGSLYGGFCLGPVNTAAIHALAYPLGSEFKIPHGISNALLLPYILEFNLPYGTERYSAIAKKIGVKQGFSELDIAKQGIKLIADLCKDIGIPAKLSSFNISVEQVPFLAKSALSVERLLQNNLHPLNEQDIKEIYYKLF